MTIRERGERTWQVRVSAGIDSVTGKRRVITETVHGAKRAAQQREAQLVAEHTRRARRSAATLDQCLAKWAEDRPLQKGTRDNYERVRRLIPPRMMSKPVERLGTEDFAGLYRTLEKVGNPNADAAERLPVGLETIRTLHRYCRAAVNLAIKYGWLTDNPVARATPPAKVKSKASAFTKAELAAIKKVLADSDPAKHPDYAQFAVWLRVAYISGARRSEVIALRWSAIDHIAGGILIAVALNKDRSVKDTKTHQERTVELDAETMTMIRKWQVAQRERALAGGKPLDPNPYLFSNENDSSIPWRPDSTSRMFARLCKAANVTGRRLHDLRHTSASELLGSGHHDKVVAERLGHASTVTTRTMYNHVLEDAAKAAADHLGQNFGT